MINNNIMAGGYGIYVWEVLGDLWINNNNITSQYHVIWVDYAYGDATTNNNTIEHMGVGYYGIYYFDVYGALEIKQNIMNLDGGDVGIYINNYVYGKATILRNVIDPVTDFYTGIYIDIDVFIGPHSLIAHNTIYRVNNYGIYIGANTPETVAVKNNIIVGTNNATTIGIYGGVSGNCTKGVGYNDLWNCNLTLSTYDPAYGDISKDPLFVNATAKNFHLQGASPCIDTGIYIGLPYNGTAPDMGAYEGLAIAPILALLQDLRKEIATDLPAAYLTPPGYLRSKLLFYVDKAIEHYMAGDRFMTIARLVALKVRITEHVLEPWRTTLTNKVDVILALL